MKKNLILVFIMSMVQLLVSNEVLAQSNSTAKDTTRKKTAKDQRRIFVEFDEEPKFKGGDPDSHSSVTTSNTLRQPLIMG